jgi:O-antigen/teichoic acid export membrane protein
LHIGTSHPALHLLDELADSAPPRPESAPPRAPLLRTLLGSPFVVYLFARGAGAVLSFVSLRFVVAFLARPDYGEWGFLAAISAMLVPVVSLTLPSAMMRGYFDLAADDTAGQAALVTTTGALNAGLAALCAVGAILLRATGVITTPTLAYVGAVTTGALVLSFFDYLARTRQDRGLYLINRLLQGGLFLALVALAVATGRAAPGGEGLGWLGRSRLLTLVAFLAIATWTANVVCLGTYIRRGVLRRGARRLGLAEIRALLAYAVPIAATELLGWVLSSSQIYVLRRFGGPAATADYVFAMSLATVVGMVTDAALADWPRFYYATMRAGATARDALIANRAALLLLAHALAIVGLRAALPLLYRVLGAQAYLGGRELVRVLALSNFLLLAGNLLSVGIGYVKRTSLWLINFAIPGVLNVVLNLVLVPRHGAAGAVSANLVALAAFAVLSYAMGRPHYRFARVPVLGLCMAGAVFAALVPVGGGW